MTTKRCQDSRRCNTKRRHRTSHRHSRHRRQRLRSLSTSPRLSTRDFCHICIHDHWTIDCPRLRAHPEDYPLLDRKRGCWKCAQRGHNAEQCHVKKYLCKECGGVHDTKECAFDYVGKEWHEFFDTKTRHLFYTNAEETESQWNPPTHELDFILWYCSHCEVMIPSKYNECLQCHRVRPQSAPIDDDESSSSLPSSECESDFDNGHSEDNNSSVSRSLD